MTAEVVTAKTVTVEAGRLTALVGDIFLAAGCDAEEARAVATHLVEANLTGHDSHGVCKIPEYVGVLRDGRVKSGRRVTVVRDAGAVLVLEGNLGLGQVVARQAMELGIARARELGAAVVALRHAHHIGRVGAWAEQCAAAGCVSIHFVNVTGHAPYVAPFGGRDGRLGTDPFCVGLPATGRPPIILDFATSKVAWGKLLVAKNKGETVAPGAVLDALGRPSTDPGVMFQTPPGVMLPFGEHKGYGLAVICDLLAGALVAGGSNSPLTVLNDTAVNNMLSVVIDTGALVEGSVFGREVDALVDWLKASRTQGGVEEILVPGEPERRRRDERTRDGIAIDRVTWNEIAAAARLVGCDPGPWGAA